VTLPDIEVPAPVYAGLTLHDPGDNPIVDAIVRVFRLPSQGGTGSSPAVEVGHAITDDQGHYDMYLAPPAQ
jgi:hypothetical protein